MVRKLTTILAADVAGYSQLIEQNEQGTLEALRRVRELVAQVVFSHNGRVFGGAGDSIIAEFGSAVEATKAAITIQEDISRSGGSDGKEPELRFRIGVNIGDVVVEGDDLLGDGVNVAARLEALAEPGGIRLSHAVFEQVQGKVEARFEPLGQHKLKNIARRVSVYRVVRDNEPRLARSSWRFIGQRYGRVLGPVDKMFDA
jgi:adenylate cyclase